MTNEEKVENARNVLSKSMKEGDTVYGVLCSRCTHGGTRVNEVRYFHNHNGQLFDVTLLITRALELPKSEVKEQRGTCNVLILCDDNGFENVHHLSRLLHPELEKVGYSLVFRSM